MSCRIFGLIICIIFMALLLSVVWIEVIANATSSDRETLNASKPYINHSNILASSAEQNTNNITKDTVSDFIFQQDSHPYNLSYADWTAKWWQWAYSSPIRNPSYDDTGKYCSESQKTPVWFLTLSFGHPVTRNCYIPENTALLATLLNSECSYAEYANLTNESELRDCAKEQQDHVVSPTARINDIEIPNLEEYRIQSGLFNITLPANNILDLPAQTTQAVSDGNWLFLKPLPEGTYNLILKGNIDDNINNDTENGSPLAFAGPIGWNYTTTHILTVK